jgi:hypothetical protein
MSRYNRRQTAINSNEMYEDHFEVRDIKRINQYRTPIFRYPTHQPENIENIITGKAPQPKAETYSMSQR